MRTAFVIEKKRFIIELIGDKIYVTEEGKGFTVTSDFPDYVGKWLALKLKWLSGEFRGVGFAGSNRAEGRDVILTVKNNKAGTFLRILNIHKQGKRQVKTLCCPYGKNGDGWTAFHQAINKVLGGIVQNLAKFREISRK